MNKKQIIFEIQNSNLSEECKKESIQIIKQYGVIDMNTFLLIVYKLIEISPEILKYFSLK